MHYTCVNCGAFDEDGCFEELASRDKEIEQFRAKIKELKEIVDEYEDGTVLMAGYNQCLTDLRNVVDGTLEITRAQGPAEGLSFLLDRLAEKDVIIDPRRVPHDWLSRWKVELT